MLKPLYSGSSRCNPPISVCNPPLRCGLSAHRNRKTENRKPDFCCFCVLALAQTDRSSGGSARAASTAPTIKSRSRGRSAGAEAEVMHHNLRLIISGVHRRSSWKIVRLVDVGRRDGRCDERRRRGEPKCASAEFCTTKDRSSEPGPRRVKSAHRPTGPRTDGIDTTSFLASPSSPR